jgi:hypothetical protein
MIAAARTVDHPIIAIEAGLGAVFAMTMGILSVLGQEGSEVSAVRRT